jgi:probable rRNA maturation factor
MAIRVIAVRSSGVSERVVIGLAKKAARAMGRPEDDIAVVFTNANAMRKLNHAYRGKDRTTDVLSFPADAEGELGDIFIAPVVARVKAEERGVGYREYLALLIVHSVLHLGGYDHHAEKEAAAMARMEKKILKSF